MAAGGCVSDVGADAGGLEEVEEEEEGGGVRVEFYGCVCG